MRIDHVAIAVENLDEAIQVYSKFFGKNPDAIEVVEEQKVRVAVYRLGDARIEVMEPISDDSPISGFLKKRGSGLHHIAFRVDDIRKKLSELKEQGFRLIDEEPRVGAEGKLIAFVHPKAMYGVLTELTQDKGEYEDVG
jgi:methylmalonyl-CoA/ethylmalonyl-CoA epimerase